MKNAAEHFVLAASAKPRQKPPESASEPTGKGAVRAFLKATVNAD